MSAPRYEVRCGQTPVPYFRRSEDEARRLALRLDREHWPCSSHRVWSIDPDGTETDITDEQGAQE